MGNFISVLDKLNKVKKEKLIPHLFFTSFVLQQKYSEFLLLLLSLSSSVKLPQSTLTNKKTGVVILTDPSF